MNNEHFAKNCIILCPACVLLLIWRRSNRKVYCNLLLLLVIVVDSFSFPHDLCCQWIQNTTWPDRNKKHIRFSKFHCRRQRTVSMEMLEWPRVVITRRHNLSFIHKEQEWCSTVILGWRVLVGEAEWGHSILIRILALLVSRLIIFGNNHSSSSNSIISGILLISQSWILEMSIQLVLIPI